MSRASNHCQIQVRTTDVTWRVCAFCTMVTLISVMGCDRKQAQENITYLDTTIKELNSLGWLGGRAHPATRTVNVPIEPGSGQSRAVGGMVVAEVMADAPLAEAGVIRGDVLVRVGEEWLPNKEDPSRDLIRAIEAEVSAGIKPIALTVLRSDKVVPIQMKHDLTPLEFGLPAASQRLSAIAKSGLDWLARQQKPDGSLVDSAEGNDISVLACAIAGLAFTAGGNTPDQGPHAEALSRCRDLVDSAAVVDESNPLGIWSSAWATMFLAELAGPLDIKLQAPTHLPMAGDMELAETTMMQLPEGASSGMVFYSAEGDVPEGLDIEKMMAEGNVQVTMIGAGGGFAMPEAAAALEPNTEFAEGVAWTTDELKLIAGEDTVKRLQPLVAAVKHLVSLQHDNGSWDSDGSTRGFSEKTLATNQALLALGMAQPGAPVDAQILKAGLDSLRARTNDGHVFTVATPGFDRRREAGRSSGAAAALTSLKCIDTDEFLKELVAYSDRNGAAIPECGVAVPLHVLNTAILRRQRGADSWASFFEEFRHVIVGLQDPDGSFASVPTRKDRSENFGEFLREKNVRTAIWSLIAALQSDLLPVLTARAENPLQPAITSQGAHVVGPIGMPTGAPMMMNDEEARQMLEKMGIDLDEVLRKSVQSGTVQSTKDE